jgi:hypothetical protein
LGFEPSEKGKTIPSFLHALPVEYRASFLKGLFSADGGIQASSGDVILTIESPELKKQVRHLLVGLGIRTNNFEGSTKELIIGTERSVVPAKNKLTVKDRRAYFSMVGFLQDHKQPDPNLLGGHDPSHLPIPIQVKYCRMLAKSSLSRQKKNDVRSFTTAKKRLSVSRLKKLCREGGVDLPDWLDKYHFVQVRELIDHQEYVKMCDITVFDDEHAFVAGGVVVHNSSNEWRMTSSRDKGLRPLLNRIESFLNEDIFPAWNPDYAAKYKICFVGLDAETREEETRRLQSEVQLHTTIDEARTQAQLPPIELGGGLILHPALLETLKTNMPKGVFMEKFMNIKGASERPDLQYIPDAFWFQFQQFTLQLMQQQAQAQATLQNPEPEPGEPTPDNPEEKEKQQIENDHSAALEDHSQKQSSAQSQMMAVDQFIQANPGVFKSMVDNLHKKDWDDSHVDVLRDSLVKDFERASSKLLKDMAEAIKDDLEDRDSD